MARTLAERLRAHEQNKARLAEAEAKLKRGRAQAAHPPPGRGRRPGRQGRTARSRQQRPLRRPALAARRRRRQGPGRASGPRSAAAPLPARPAPATRARSRCCSPSPRPLAKDATTALRRAGFRFSRVLQHWEGLARYDEAAALAKAHGGTARRVGAAPALADGEATQRRHGRRGVIGPRRL